VRRGDQHDPAPVAPVLRRQPPCCFTRAEEGAEHVGAEHRLKLVSGQLRQPAGRACHDGVIDEAADRAEGGVDGLEGTRHIGLASDVCCDGRRLATGGLDLCDHPRSVVRP